MWAIIYGFLGITGITVNEHFEKGEVIKSNDEQGGNTETPGSSEEVVKIGLYFPNNHIVKKSGIN